MKARCARWVGIVGLTLFIGCFATAGDRRITVDDNARTVVAHAFPEAAFLKQGPPGGTPFLRTVYWTDVGPDDSFEGWLDSVSRRPRRAGLFTLLSYYEIVAVNVRVRVNGASRSQNTLRRNAAQNTFQQLQRTRNALREMTRDGSGTEPGSGVNLARTFLSGVVVERFSLEGPQGQGGGHLHSRLMTTGQAGEGWSLQGVQVEAADGQRLTIAGAEWRRDGSLVATGTYTLEKDRTTRTGLQGCFLIHIDGPLSFRQVSATTARNTVCAPALPVAGSAPWSPAMPLFHHDGRDARAAWPIAILVQPMLGSLPTTPVPALAGTHPDLSWRPQR